MAPEALQKLPARDQRPQVAEQAEVHGPKAHLRMGAPSSDCPDRCWALQCTGHAREQTTQGKAHVSCYTPEQLAYDRHRLFVAPCGLSRFKSQPYRPT